jgi:hypothetical protein
MHKQLTVVDTLFLSHHLFLLLLHIFLIRKQEITCFSLFDYTRTRTQHRMLFASLHMRLVTLVRILFNSGLFFLFFSCSGNHQVC